MGTDDYASRAETAMTPISPDARSLVPIVDSGEQLLSLEDACPTVRVRLRIPARHEYVGKHTLLAREGVCVRLNRVAESVGPGYQVEVFDAYRPLDYQRWRYEQVSAQVRFENPDLEESALRGLVDRWVAEPSEDPGSPPPHSTGGALDMLLITRDGEELDFGSRPGDYSAGHAELHYTNVPGVSETARGNRLRLLRAAVDAGFANHPSEWWHYSYGDQEWCLHTRRAQVAIYGRASANER